ncbi:MAG: hypothetical protein MAG715_00926 [Methanonatronarchaeales archaeon]|nr:hypothetical protein [Methanonatronarchaeales archaeon]
MLDPHTHVDRRGDDDLELLALSGVETVLTLAHDPAPFSEPASILDHFHQLTGRETKRGGPTGLEVLVAIGVYPGALKSGVDEVLERLPRLLAAPPVTAVGEIGLSRGTPGEERLLGAQMEIARDEGYPCVVHTPHDGKPGVVEQVLNVADERSVDPTRLIVDHLDASSVGDVLAAGPYAGVTLKIGLDETLSILEEHGTERITFNSDLNSGFSDPMALSRAALEMRRRGFSEKEIEAVTDTNAREALNLD